MANCSPATTSEASQMATPPKFPLLKILRDGSQMPMMMQYTDRCEIFRKLDSCYEEGMVTFSFNVPLEALREGFELSCVYCKTIYTSRSIYAMAMPHGVNRVGVSSKHMVIRWRWPHGPKIRDRTDRDDVRDIQLQISLCQQARPWGRFQTW